MEETRVTVDVTVTDEDATLCSHKKEISTSPTHPLVPTVIQPDGTVGENRRTSVVMYPRSSSSRSHLDRHRHESSASLRRSHEVISTVTEGLDCGLRGPGRTQRPHNLGLGVGYTPHRRLTLADALVPRGSAIPNSNHSSPRRHSAADTDNSDVQAELTLEALLLAGSRRNSLLRVDDHLSRRSSRSSRCSSSRRRSSSSKRHHRKVSTASVISGYDKYSYNDGTSLPSGKSCQEEDEDEDEEVVRKRRRIAKIVGSVAAAIFMGAILLVALTLSMTPTIDEMGPLRRIFSRHLPVSEHWLSTSAHFPLRCGV